MTELKAKILLTGTPGIGKTTLVRKVVTQLMNSLSGMPLSGFYTEEVREKGFRIGFDIVTLEGDRAPLARVAPTELPGSRVGPRVGQYAVQLSSFERLMRRSLTPPTPKRPEHRTHLVVVDEIGKMELFSDEFKQVVTKLFSNRDNVILATIPVPKQRAIPFVEQLRSRDDVTVLTVSHTNRDSLDGTIVNALKSHLHTSMSE